MNNEVKNADTKKMTPKEIQEFEHEYNKVSQGVAKPELFYLACLFCNKIHLIATNQHNLCNDMLEYLKKFIFVQPTGPR